MTKKVLSLVGFFILSSFPAPAPANDVAIETDPARVKETIIFIPAREMKSILGIEKEGVFVTYDEYKSLYEKAKNAHMQSQSRDFILPDAQGPVIIQANYSGSVIGELLQFEARFKIVQNKKEPSILDFPLKGVRYQSARLNGKKVQIYQQNREPRIIIPGAGSHDLVVRFLLPVTIAEKKGFVSFDCPPAILGSIRITADPFYEIKLNDLLFTSRRQIEAKTEFVGFIGSKSAVSLEITNRRSFGERRVKISSRETHHVFVDRDIINHQTDFHLRIRDGEIKGVAVEIGKKDRVYSLTGSGISGWTREELGAKSVLHCTFHVPITNQTKFNLKTYAYNEPGDRPFSLEDNLIQGLFERKGALFVFYANNTRIKTEDVRFLGPIEKQSAIRKTPEGYTLHRGYGLFNLPYRLGYSFQDMPSRAVCSQFNHVSLEYSKIHFRSENRLYGLEPGSTQFVFSFPEGYRLRDVVALINGKRVKQFHDLAEGEGLLTITMTNPVSAKDEVAFIVTSELFLDEDLLKKGAYRIEIPVVSYTRTSRMTGTLHLSIADRYLLEAMTMDGYRPSRKMSDLNVPAESRDKQRLIYEFRTISPRGALTLSYRKGEQTSNTVSYIAVDQDVLQASAYIRYEISGASRASFYFALPRWENSKINIIGADIKEKKKVAFEDLNAAVATATAADLKDLDIWNVILQEEVKGTYLLSVDYQKKIKDYGLFSEVPLVMPVGVSNDTGHIVMEAGQDTEIKVKKTGLNAVEIYEIPEWPSYKPSNRIIESLRYFSRPFTFEIAVLRREESPILAALAEQETITYTLGNNSDVFFEFDYRIKNTNLQFLKIRFPGDHILWSATLQGKGIKPRKGKGNLLLFPLVSGDATIDLRLTGHVPTRTKWSVWKSFDISSPALPIPAMRSQVRVFFPKDYYLFSQKGNFERIPYPAGQKPLVVSFFRRLISSFQAGMRPFSVPFFSIRAQKIAAPVPPMEESKRLPGSIETKDDLQGAGIKEGYDRPSEVQALAPTGRLAQKAPETAGMSSDQYFRKKGILAMNINIPKEGVLLPADKLWGESRLRVQFLSAGWKRAFGIFAALMVIALGFYLTRKRIMSPLGFLITALVLFTFLPMIILKSLVFIFDGALLGALVFAAMSFIWAIIKKSESDKGALVGLVFISVTVACLFFAFNDALAASENPFPDIKIYVPYEEKVPVDVEGTHKVFIPTKDYFLLKFLADPPYRPQKVFEYENEYNITGLVAKGNLEGSMVKFTALLDVFVNTDKWALIELPFANVFITALTLDNEQIPVRTAGGAAQKKLSLAGEKVFYEIPVLGSGRHSLAIDFYVQVTAFAGKKTIAFGFPEALCSDFSLYMPDRDVLLKFEEPKDGFYTKNIADGILTRASLSEKSFVKISWFPKKFIKKTERPLVYADSEINMFMDYEEVLVSQNTKIRVEKSALASVLFHKHPELMIVDVFSDKVKNWRSLNQNGKTMIEVTFKNEITETAELLVRAKMKKDPTAPIPVVFLEPVEAERFRGNLNLYGLDDYRLLVSDVKGLTISDTGKRHWKEFPGFELQKSYTFTGSAFQAEIVNIPRERKIYADIFGQYTFTEDLLTANFSVDLDVKESFLTSIRLRIPAGFRIGAVDASDISDLHLQPNGVLVLPFQHAVRGKIRFGLVLEKELASFDAASVEGIELFEIEKVTGRLLVLFPKSFEIRESDISQIRPIDIETLSAHIGQADQGRFGAKYAYQFKEKPFKVQYEVSRKKPLLDLVKVYHARVEDNLVNVNVLSLFQIKNAPVDHFTILAPARIKDSIMIAGEGIKSILKKTDNEGKNVRITVHTLSGIERSYLMQVSFNQYLGRDRVFEMPHIVFPQVKSKTQFVSIEPATVYHVETKASEAMLEIESETIPALPAGIDLNNVLWAYRITDSDDWRYTLELKRLEREKLIRATILREDIRTLIIPQGYALHEITLKANNRVLQFLPLDFPVDAELWSLKVAGEPVAASIAKTPDKENVKRLLVPLIKSSTGDRNFDIKLVYMTPSDKFGLRGKIKPAMVQTGSIPVEKTTWTLYVPESYSYPEPDSNMEEVDITVIEADKTLELAREYEYWTNMAKTVKGKLKQRAVLNRGKVMTDYLRQQSMTRQLQSDLDQRIQKKQPGDRQTLLQKSQSHNVAVLNEALDIIESNKPASKMIESPEKKSKEKAISGRKDIMGWQFKTKDFAEQDKVQESITSLLQSEDEKKEIQKKRTLIRKPSKTKKRRAVAHEQEEPAPAAQGSESQAAGAVQKMEVGSIRKPETGKQQSVVVEDRTAPSSTDEFRDSFKPAPPRIQKEMVPQQALPVKKSTLLRGLRSMDIPLPEQGLRLSFKKLGGNPAITLPYRKKGILSKLLYLLLLLAVTAGTLRFRKWRFPAARISGDLKDKSLADFYHILMNSRIVKVIPTLMMIAALIMGFPWFIMGLGFNSILLLRYLSIKRYKKKDWLPSYNYKIFLKYFISYIILASSFLFMVTLFHELFFISLLLSTVANCIYCFIYAAFYIFTKTKPTEKFKEDESNRITALPAEKEPDKD